MTDIELIVKIPKRVYNYIRKYEHIANSDVCSDRRWNYKRICISDRRVIT